MPTHARTWLFLLVSLALVASCDGGGSSGPKPPKPSGLYPTSGTHPVPAAPSALAAADLDGDGRTELVVAGGLAGSAVLEVFDDNLASRGTHDLGWFLTDVEVGDLDQDGRPDLVAVGYGPQGEGYQHVLFGKAKLGFDLGIQNALLGVGPTDVELADVDGDGELDLVSCDEGSNALSVVLNTPGPGRSFEAPLTQALSIAPTGVRAGDLDGDGVTDLAVLSEPYNRVSVLLGAGDGSFTETASGLFAVAPAGPTLVDLDRDGALDLVFTSTQSGVRGVQTCFGAGDGSFGSHQVYELGGEPRATLVLDFDGDGNLDVVAANRTLREVTVLRGNVFGFLGLPVSYATEGAPEDVVAFAHALGGIAMITSAPDALVTGVGLPSYPGALDPASIEVADLDGDGRAELLVPDRGGQGGVVVLGRSDPVGSEGSVLFVDQRYAMGGTCTAVTVGEFTGDVVPEIAATLDQFGPDFVSVVTASSFPGQPELTPLAGADPVAIEAGFLDGDLDADLVVVNQGTEDLEVLLGNGGSFLSTARYAVGQAPVDLRLAYLNGDSILDAVVLNGGSGDVSVLIGFADGSFVPEVRYAANSAAGAGSSSADFALADLDGNGLADVVAAGSGPAEGELAVLFSNGDGTFRSPVLRSLGGDPRALVLADVWKRDGRLDLLVADHGSPHVRLFVGLGGAKFGQPNPFLVGVEPTVLATAPALAASAQEVYAGRAVSGKVAVLAGRVFID